MNEDPLGLIPDPGNSSVREQLILAARDLWTMVEESGEDFVVFTDRRRLHTRIERRPDGQFAVLWEDETGNWSEYDRTFQNPREAAFHGYQGPH